MKKVSTKTKILSTSLQLFNEKGLSQVTLRTIASAMNISQGNLNYHYKKRDDIIEALYHELVAKINESISECEDSYTLEAFFIVMDHIMENFNEYRFFLLDFVHIMRDHKKIRDHYALLTEERKKQMLRFFNELNRTGMMRGQQFNEEHEYLFIRMQILTDFCFSNASVSNREISIAVKEKYREIILHELHPYLTEKGMEKFEKLIRKSHKN